MLQGFETKNVKNLAVALWTHNSPQSKVKSYFAKNQQNSQDFAEAKRYYFTFEDCNTSDLNYFFIILLSLKRNKNIQKTYKDFYFNKDIRKQHIVRFCQKALANISLLWQNTQNNTTNYQFFEKIQSDDFKLSFELNTKVFHLLQTKANYNAPFQKDEIQSFLSLKNKYAKLFFLNYFFFLRQRQNFQISKNNFFILFCVPSSYKKQNNNFYSKLIKPMCEELNKAFSFWLFFSVLQNTFIFYFLNQEQVQTLNERKKYARA